MQFEWGDDKAEANLGKHGVSFEEALTCFYDPEQVALYDPQHSEDEDREMLIGHPHPRAVKTRQAPTRYQLKSQATVGDPKSIFIDCHV